MIQYIAPEKIIPSNLPKVFLAGSIEQGTAELWQEYVVNLLGDNEIVVFNPRRKVWDATLSQDIQNDIFREQVEWELDALDTANYILFYFDPNTKSPITLLELGLHAHSNKCIVVCPEPFWRKGNVDIVCNRYNILQYDTLDHAIQYLQQIAA